jgi:hypothetical protein
MFHIFTILFFCCLMIGCGRQEKSAPSSAGVIGDEKISFNTHIQPILSENCYHCHGPDSGTREPASAPLRLDRKQFAFEAREDGKPVIVKGDPAASLLVQLVRSKDPDLVMPPPNSHKGLTPDQIEKIEKWVAQGAEYEEHWAFVPPRRAQTPAVLQPKSVTNPVDAFVQEKLAEKGLKPAPPEDPRVLARRAALDLTGLLPEAAEVDKFAADPSEAAYTAYLEKLFATPAYAEHRARYWLDYSRYADTHGLHLDNRRSIWPYRDYVIRSFAAHKPYDEFVREQVAGDLIPATTADAWIATGYIRCNLSTNETGTIPEEIQADKTRDRTEAFGATFLGLTVGCAACHDHKFDPTSQKDFYALSAFFNNTTEKSWDDNSAESQPVLRLPSDEKRAEFDLAVARRTAAASAFEAKRSAAPKLFSDWLAAGNKPTSVSSEGLELRLRLDEGSGDLVKNSAPFTKTASYKTDTNPPIWGEQVWLWPAMRMDLSTNLAMPDQGDFEQDSSFSVSMWTMLRMKTRGATTGNGSLISRMGDVSKDAHRGWDLFVENNKLVVNIVHQWPDAALRVEAGSVPRGEWVHLGATYDGSGKAEGVKLFVNGKLRPATIIHNSLKSGQTIRNSLSLHLGRRQGSDPLREAAFQDVRVYRRVLDAAEFSRLPYEDLGAEILAASPDPANWTAHEKFIALDRFFLASIDKDAPQLDRQVKVADDEVNRLGKGGTATMIARERSVPATAWVLDRGVYSARKLLVSPASPGFLPGDHGASNRLELAEWLFKPENPLFARVTVNRIWQEIFGVGLVSTADDFGIMGARPSNQKLLDWLAVEFRESGWDMKHIYQLLLTSTTYRQSNQVTPAALAGDPSNIFLSRGPRFRMDAEVLRDTALQASGLLSFKIGGAPVKPYQPKGIWETVSMPESDTLKYKQDEGDALYRRSLYSFWKRFAPPPSLETFDARAREVVCITRARTNTPLQALVSMNDPQFFEAARKLAERAILTGSSVQKRMDFISSQLLSRPLNNREKTTLEAQLIVYQSYYQAHPQDAVDLLTTGAAAVNSELQPSEIAAWTMLANQFLNLDETLTK